MRLAASIIIPVAPYHTGITHRAISSAYAQTLPAEVIPVPDIEGRGPGWARNHGLAKASAPFVVFLDADDQLEPHFLATLIRHYQPGRYVYADWYEDGRRIQAPDCDAWITPAFHLVTCLIPTAAIRRIGGFDESLPAIEDTDFFLRLRQSGYCGLRVPQALSHYHVGGQRSQTFQESPERDAVRRQVMERYRELMSCGSCGGGVNPTITNGQYQQGDVVAEALQPGTQYGPSGRFYARRVPGERLWVSAYDAQLRPDLWRVIVVPDDNSPDIEAVLAMAQNGGA